MAGALPLTAIVLITEITGRFGCSINFYRGRWVDIISPDCYR